MSNWKEVERRVAAILGGRRVPITGRQRGDAPDIAHEWLGVEVKHRKKLPDWIHDAMAQARACSDGGKLPTVILHEHNQLYTKSFVVLELDEFEQWFGRVTNKREELT